MPVGFAHQDRQQQAARIGQDNGVCCRACAGRLGWGRCSGPPGARDAYATDACPAPVDLLVLAQPMKQCLLKAVQTPSRFALPQHDLSRVVLGHMGV